MRTLHTKPRVPRRPDPGDGPRRGCRRRRGAPAAVAFQLAEELPYDEFDLASQLAAERGWMVPAYTMPPNADHVKMLRVLVKLNLTHALVGTLADDLAATCETLERKGGLSEAERQRVKSNIGF
jgi:glutamate decarboxylase